MKLTQMAKTAPLLLLLPLVASTTSIPESFAQYIDTPSTLSVLETSDAPYIYKNQEGKTVVIGEVENRNTLSAMSDIQIQVIFYDSTGIDIIEVADGSTILDVVPPQETSPYIITSKSANPAIGKVSVSVNAFNSAPSKTVGLELAVSDITHYDHFNFTGTIKNVGKASSDHTIAYIVFYDIFSPPRLLHIEPISIGHLLIDESIDFSFSKLLNPRAVGFKIFAQSDIFHSNSIDNPVPSQKTQVMTELVQISPLTITDYKGNKMSSIKINSDIRLGSSLEFSSTDNTTIQPYTFHVQVIQSGDIPFIEFIASDTGVFYGDTQKDASVIWTPKNTGLYFVETYVWDMDGIPIAAKGPVSLILVKE